MFTLEKTRFFIMVKMSARLVQLVSSRFKLVPKNLSMLMQQLNKRPPLQIDSFTIVSSLDKIILQCKGKNGHSKSSNKHYSVLD